MKSTVSLPSIFFVVLLLSCAGTLTQKQQEEKDTQRIQNSQKVLQSLLSNELDKRIPTSILKSSYGIIVVPKVLKSTFIIGGNYGFGTMVVRQPNGNWSLPSFIQLKGGSVGLQFGVAVIDLVMVFKNKAAIDSISKGKLILGSSVDVAAGPIGRTAGAATTHQLNADILTYAHSQGLYAGISLTGLSLGIDNYGNAAFYNTSNLSENDIINRNVTSVPPIAYKYVAFIDSITGTHVQDSSGPSGKK